MRAALLLMAVSFAQAASGCGGRILDDAATADPCPAPAGLCDGAPQGRCDYACPDGSVAYRCWGYTEAELDALGDQGDTIAGHCLATLHGQ